MLICKKQKNDKYIEVHTSAEGKEYVCIEIYNCTPEGKICEKSVVIEEDVFNLISE